MPIVVNITIIANDDGTGKGGFRLYAPFFVLFSYNKLLFLSAKHKYFKQ